MQSLKLINENTTSETGKTLQVEPAPMWSFHCKVLYSVWVLYNTFAWKNELEKGEWDFPI